MSSQQTPTLYVGSEADIHKIVEILKSRPYQPSNQQVVFATELPMPLVVEFGVNIGSEHPTTERTSLSNVKTRDMRQCFHDKQLIRHWAFNTFAWVGSYNKSTNEVVVGEEPFRSLSGFAAAHYKREYPSRNPATNGWTDCECEVNGEWVKIDSK
jgi:hypothetical protein